MFVTFLAPVLERRREALLKAGVKQMRAIAYELRYIPLTPQQVRNVVLTADINWLPGEVWPSQAAGRDIGTVGNRRETPRIESFNAGRSRLGEPVEQRCTYWSLCSVEQIVVAESVGNEKDYVLHGMSPLLRGSIRCYRCKKETDALPRVEDVVESS